MKTITDINKTINKENSKFLELLCNEKSDIVIKTEFGVGHYIFEEFKELKGSLVLQFKLLDDNKFHDTNNIHNHIGNHCFLTVGQYLYAYSYIGFA